MLPGPVFNVELLTTARRRRYFVIRSLYGSILLFLIWTNYSSWASFNDQYASPNQVVSFAQATFASIVSVQVMAVLGITTTLVGGVIANEKQRKTLHDLLASRLTSSEIVLGKLLARMLHLAVLLAVSLPVLSLLSLFGGVEPLYAMFSFASTLSIGFFLASISIYCSTTSRTVRSAIMSSFLIEVMWLALPGLIRYLMPGIYPELYAAIEPANTWIYATTPWPSLESLAMGNLATLWVGLGWMIGLQVALGVAFNVAAIHRLRPVYQSHDAPGGFRLFGRRFGGGAKRHFRLLPRIPVGDRAMIWKEMFTSKSHGMTQIFRLVVGLSLAVGVVIWCVTFGVGAFWEMVEDGYGSLGQAREYFNIQIRFVSTTLYILALLGAAVGGANTFTSERENDTWISLIATPLEGREIVYSKIAGVLWHLLPVVSLMAFTWIAGVVCGAVHPVGLLCVSIEMLAFLGFAAILGTFFSIASKSSWKAQTTTVAVLFVLNGGYLMCLCPLGLGGGRIGMWVAAGVTPFLHGASLMSPSEFGELFRDSRGAYDFQFEMVAACFLGTLGYGTAAFLLAETTLARFNNAAERPTRSSSLRPYRFSDPPAKEKSKPLD